MPDSPQSYPTNIPVGPAGADPDAALKTAIKSALDAGMLERATALLEVLRASGAPATVISLDDARRKGAK